ncbi:MAG: rubrerythrin family protein [Lachnospiraceae bacterium]
MNSINLKGTQSEQNIKAALTGESIARNKYSYYALKAHEEGNEEIAQLFERMAKNEMTHAKIWYTLLNGDIDKTEHNLLDAASGENTEWRDMYPSFAQKAREEGLDSLAQMFEKVAEIEHGHEKQFLKTLIEFKKKSVDVSTDKIAETPVPTMKTVSVPGYRCQFCGATFETLPDVCDVCKAIGAFDRCTIEKDA